MSDTDFYSLNTRRRYPLVDEAYVAADVSAAHPLLVDFGVVLLPGSGFDQSNAEHRIFLTRWGLIGGLPTLAFRFVCSGADIDGETLTITGDGIDMQMVPFTVSGATAWGFGFAVVGLVNAFPEAVVDITSAVVSSPDSYPHIERRCVQALRGHFVTRFRVANEARTRVVETASSSSSSDSLRAYEYAPREPVEGHVRFAEGYNCRIVAARNAIRFSAVRGAGAGEACEEVPKTGAEEASDGALDGAARCYETIRRINGVGPDANHDFTIAAGRGIEVFSPAAHTIRIRTRDDLTACE